MTKNVGIIDRIIRVAVGLLLLAIPLLAGGSAWGYVGIVPLLTGLIGWCPPYKLLGISTVCKSCCTKQG